MSTFMDAMAEGGYPDDEYYMYTETKRYHFKNVSPDVLQKVLNHNKIQFVNKFNKLNRTKSSGEDIAKMLNDFTANGEVGQRILSVLDEILNFKEGTNGISQNVFTSGGVAVTTNGGKEITLSQALTTFHQEEKTCLNNVNRIAEGAETAINSMIKVLIDSARPAAASVLLSSYYSNNNGELSDEGKKLMNSFGLTEITPGKDDEVILKATGEKIKENIDILKKLANTTKKDGDWESEKDKNGNITKEGRYVSYSKAVEGLKASFNSLGGTINEMAFSYALYVALHYGLEEIHKGVKLKNDEFTQQEFKKTWSGHTESGQDLKPDVQITYSNGVITVTIGGSIKLRQGAGFKSQNGKNSNRLGVTGLIARSRTYGWLKNRMNSYVPKIHETGYQMVALNYEKTEKATAEYWRDLKNLTGALLFLDALSGLGKTKDDFASLFVVNNRIFSVYDILDKMTNGEYVENQLKQGGHNMYEVSGFDLNKLSGEVMEKSQVGGDGKGEEEIIKEALDRNEEARTVLTNAKISITLNLGNLYGSDVFK